MFYKMLYNRNDGDFIKLKNFPEQINKRAVINSEFQYLDKNPIQIEVSEEGGIDFPDFIDEYNMPLFSENLKTTLDNEKIENIFYKPIILNDNLMETKKKYWLAVSDKIDCLNLKESKADPELSFPVFTKITIYPHKIGNYKIFKIKQLNPDFFILTQSLMSILKDKKLKGISFEKI
ncbi:MAG: DUF1629 domain-containing protein [Bacilli bacterium]|jgi:hypothetical protein